jgi:hypothetical protein
MASDRLPATSKPVDERRSSARAAPRRQALLALSRPIPGKPSREKPLPPAVIERVITNEPFEGYPEAVWKARHALSLLGMPLQLLLTGSAPEPPRQFLRRLFPRLAAFRQVSFLPRQAAPQGEAGAIRSASYAYRQAGLTTQAQELQAAYEGLDTLRRFYSRPSRRRISKGALLLETAVPVRYLPEILVAAPVWFTEENQKTRGSFPSMTREVEYFCELGKSDPFAYLFQLYNDTHRPFHAFTGPDPVPLELARVITEFRERFDYLVIATPYHDLAFASVVPRLPAYVDPFLFGFLRTVPDYFFCLGRWSGTGLFPLIPEMIADTLLHLRQNRERFSTHPWAYFRYKTLPPESGASSASGPRLRLAAPGQRALALPPSPGRRSAVPVANDTLAAFLEQVLTHFAQGTLFPWLRGEEWEGEHGS